ncbi:hypothetical protein [Sphingosinicella sp. CPCC 101087]|uniref:hypothetical protein n=1 Tax=Sphingosinicella sp. CPCC 101087 TaxID=2497754 RepID=UPI0013EB87BF|nr:hypothetical protein [Sphingosinicella sp. CPCC 101087]
MADGRKAATGGTAGTGAPDTNPESGGGRTGEAAEGERPEDKSTLAGGDDSAEAAIGRNPEGKPAGAGSSAERSGRRTSEGKGALDSPPDPGDPGGMGGVRAHARAIDGRPPGGVSPMAEPGEEE